jgi:DNA-binding TFAR19-related protein (PDSD5 family)
MFSRRLPVIPERLFDGKTLDEILSEDISLDDERLKDRRLLLMSIRRIFGIEREAICGDGFFIAEPEETQINAYTMSIRQIDEWLLRHPLTPQNPNYPVSGTFDDRIENMRRIDNEESKIEESKQQEYNEESKMEESEQREQEGEGVILRDPTINPPPVRNLLNSIGPEKVSSIKLIRTPLSKATQFLLNIASFGQLQEKMKEIAIDKLFHLSMLINGQYELEKNEVIKMRVNPNAVKFDSETLDVPVNTDITIQQLMDNTQKQMGQNYGSYDAKTNNCSVFLSNVLSANGLSNSNSETFINQKTEELFNSFPALSKKIVDLGTTAGAVVERQISGEGEGGYIYNFGLPRCKLLF